jgi:alkylhydroperoxidase family enzyme
MARIALPDGDGEETARLWRLRPEMGAAAAAFNESIQAGTSLPVREQEAARIRIAHINGCMPCSEARIDDMAAFGLDEAFYEDVDDPAKRGRYGPREALAIAFAERFAVGPQAFDDGFWAELRAAYTDAEIVDLAACCGKWLGLGRINAVLEIERSCPVRIPTGGAKWNA